MRLWVTEGLGNSKCLAAGHIKTALQALKHSCIGKLASRQALSAATAAAPPSTESLSSPFHKFVSYKVCACRQM